MENFKNWIIFILSAFIVASIYFLNLEDEYEAKINTIREENEKLISNNKLIDQKLDSLRLEYIILRKKDSSLIEEIKRRDLEITNAVFSAKIANDELEEKRKEVAKIRKKIEQLKNNPPNREGEDLLNSIKLKIQ